MTDFRARAVCAALAAVLFAASAAAQSNRPIRLIPGGDSLPAPERAERGVRNDGALAPTERDIAGILDFATGALPATLWTGSTRRIVDPLLGSAAVTRYATLRDLSHRVLASPANPPATDPGEALADFGALRAAALLRLGETDAARRLAARVLRFQPDEPTANAVLRETMFLAPDPGEACEQVRATAALATQPDWARALVACQAIAGDIARARLGLSLQRAQKMAADDWLERLVAYLDGAPRALEGAKADLRGHHLPLFAVARTVPPTAALPTLSPAILMALATNPAFPIDTRLRAAEIATGSFGIDGGILAELYASVAFQPREAADLPGFAAQEPGPRGRAALYRHVRNQVAGPVRASAFAQAVAAADRRGVGRAFRRAAIDLVREIPPTSDAAENALLIARTLLIERHTAEATQWYGVLDVGAGPSDGAALLRPLLFLAGVPLPEMGSPATMTAWKALQGRLDPQRAAARVRMLRVMMEAVGARALELEEPGEPMPAPPASAALDALRRAAEQKLMGETVLRAAVALAEPGLRENAVAIAAVIRALTEAGIGDEARGLALEAALAAGL